MLSYIKYTSVCLFMLLVLGGVIFFGVSSRHVPLITKFLVASIANATGTPTIISGENIIQKFGFEIIIPDWMNGGWHWMDGAGETADSWRISPGLFIPQTSDIFITAKPTTETYNASKLYTYHRDGNDNEEYGMLALSEIYLNMEGDVSIYHQQYEGRGTITDMYYISNTEKTITIGFRVFAVDSQKYSNDVHEFLKGFRVANVVASL